MPGDYLEGVFNLDR